jgi:hypothetical protein
MFTPIGSVTEWADLQTKVRDFFREMGYEANTTVTIPLSNNGKAEVDVLAEKTDTPLRQKILIECKYWNSDVPRAIVQSFKMDVQEAGANFGIIVSKQGFQSGAYEGVALTTVNLMTFEELQRAFSGEWAQKNLFPIVELNNRLVDKYRIYEVGSNECHVHKGFLFNDRMKGLDDDLRASIIFPLALFKDHFSLDPLAAIQATDITFPIPFDDGSPRTATFNDTRTLIACLKKHFEHAFRRLRNFDAALNEELSTLAPNELRAVFQ